MLRILLTGMSGTGKSTVLAALAERGCATVELDGAWCVPQPDGTQLWDEPRLTALLDRDDARVLVVAGCEANVSVFLPRFDRVILLTAPTPVILERLANRTTNAFGRTPEECARVLRDIDEVEPRLRAVAHVEIDTSGPIDQTVRRVLAQIPGDHPDVSSLEG